MEVTEARIQIPDPSAAGNDRIRAFATVVLGGEFCLRDIRVVEGPRGLLVCAPSRPLMSRCADCQARNPLSGRYCGRCGAPLEYGPPPLDDRGRPKMYTDVAFPVTQASRRVFTDAVLSAYREEVARCHR